jgi:hypothetical protein
MFSHNGLVIVQVSQNQAAVCQDPNNVRERTCICVYALADRWRHSKSSS